MTFKLPSLKRNSNANKPLVCHDLPLFQWGNLREKEEAIGRGSFGLTFVARNGHGEKVAIKKLLSEDDRGKSRFIKEEKIIHGINSEHIVKFKAACMESCAMMCEYLVFDFASFGGSFNVSSLHRLLQHLHINGATDQFPLQKRLPWNRQPGLHTCITWKVMKMHTSLSESIKLSILIDCPLFFPKTKGFIAMLTSVMVSDDFPSFRLLEFGCFFPIPPFHDFIF